MDDDQEEGAGVDPEPKISYTEAILIGIFFAGIDTVSLVLIFFGFDDFWILDALASPIFLYLFLKEVPPIRQLVAFIIELFPWVGALPCYTLGWVWTVWADHNPQSSLAKTVNTAAAVAGAVRQGRGTTMDKVKRGAAAVRAEQTATHGVERAGTREERLEKATARAEVAAERTPAEEAQKKSEAAVSDESLGAEKDPLEKLQDIMRKMPEPEKPRSEDDEDKLPRAA